MPGTLTISNISDGTNTGNATDMIRGSAKAWVNCNPTAATVRASYNVSSVTRASTGDITVNFTTALADANYAVACGAEANTGSPDDINIAAVRNGGRTSNSVRLKIGIGGSGLRDVDGAFIAIFR